MGGFLQSRDVVVTRDSKSALRVCSVHQTHTFSDGNSAEIGLTPELDAGSQQRTWKALLDVLGPGSWVMRPRSQKIKRAVDTCLSLLLLVLLSPLIALIAIATWNEADGPLFYISERVGRNGRPFRMYKFRTMIANAESIKCSLKRRNERSAVLFKVSDDPRVTRIGRLLRKYSLDEIP